MDNDLILSEQEKDLLYVRDTIAATDTDYQETVRKVHQQLCAIVESYESAGILALALLCAEIDAGEKRA